MRAGSRPVHALATWRDRWPFVYIFHPIPPATGGLCAVVSFWLFAFWLLAVIIAKTLLPEGGWTRIVTNIVSGGGSSSSKSTLPSTCSKYGKRYGVMFDAGSTGSRVHAYQFTFNLDGTVELHHELFEQVKPGLSSYKGRPDAAADSIDELLHKAKEYVPPGLHSCTPVELKATAGLRLLGEQASEELLQAVELRFKKSGFHVPPRSAIVMDGKDEGPLAWVTVNFLLGTLFDRSGKEHVAHDQHDAARHRPHGQALPHVPSHPVAILDMGGASTQIVFMPKQDPDHPQAGNVEIPSTNLYTVNLFGKQYRMYQHSHLGYGLKEAGKRIARGAVDKEAFECFPPSHAGEWSLDAGKGIKVSNTKNAVQSFTICSQYVRRFINKRASCNNHAKTCSFNGVYQPKLAEHFRGGEFYIFSYFYDRMEPFLPDNGVMTVGDFKKYGHKICDSYNKKESELSGEDLVAHKRNLGTECMDFVFLYELLSTGYDLPDDQVVHIKKKINGVETAWTLGAMIEAMQ